jgi:hypothetical protein
MDLEGEVKKLRLQEGDIVVITSKEPMRGEQSEQIREIMTNFLKHENLNNKVLVLDSLKLQILRGAPKEYEII